MLRYVIRQQSSDFGNLWSIKIKIQFFLRNTQLNKFKRKRVWAVSFSLLRKFGRSSRFRQTKCRKSQEYCLVMFLDRTQLCFGVQQNLTIHNGFTLSWSMYHGGFGKILQLPDDGPKSYSLTGRFHRFQYNVRVVVRDWEWNQGRYTYRKRFQRLVDVKFCWPRNDQFETGHGVDQSVWSLEGLGHSILAAING